MGANGDRSASRRKKRRGGNPLMPAEAGDMLREARLRLGIELAEVHDRTGISWKNLEALESGHLQRFSDPAAAAVAMRRYAELVSLDPDPLVKSVTAPVPALAGASGPGGNASWAPAGPDTEAETSGHLRRYYGDHSHLRSFTQTAQVPAVGGSTSDPVAGTFHPGGHPTGGYKNARRRRKAPWMLRFMNWFLLLLVLIGGAGIAVNHYKPQWLRDIHVLKDSPKRAGSTGTTASTQSPPSSNAGSTEPASSAVVTSRSGIGMASVKVSSSNYTVVIVTTNSCWVEAQVPGSVNPLINRTLTAGQTVSIPVTGGQLNVELGALAAGISVQIGGTTVPGWTLRPDAVPFVATFTGN